MKKKSAAAKKQVRKDAPVKPALPKKVVPQTMESWQMRLYIAGQSTRSIAAIANLRRLCDDHMPGGCTIEVIDLMRNPERAKADQILAIPTLVRKLPEPARRIIGDLSMTEKVLLSLDLNPA
ncbi:MAG: circadian clock KaiB family protein [Candidatus Binataceae bacterium]